MKKIILFLVLLVLFGCSNLKSKSNEELLIGSFYTKDDFEELILRFDGETMYEIFSVGDYYVKSYKLNDNILIDDWGTTYVIDFDEFGDLLITPDSLNGPMKLERISNEQTFEFFNKLPNNKKLIGYWKFTPVETEYYLYFKDDSNDVYLSTKGQGWVKGTYSYNIDTSSNSANIDLDFDSLDGVEFPNMECTFIDMDHAKLGLFALTRINESDIE